MRAFGGNFRWVVLSAFLAVLIAVGFAQPNPAPTGDESPTATVAELMAQLADDDPRVRESATETLANFSADIIPDLKAARAGTTDPELGARLDWLVHRLTIAHAIPQLVADDANVRRAAFETLKSYGRGALPQLRAIVETGFVGNKLVPRDLAYELSAWVNDLLRNGRERWSYDNRGGGFFERGGDGIWSEFSEGRRIARFREHAITENYIWLVDTRRRGWAVRLHTTHCEFSWQGNANFRPLYIGGFDRPIDPRSEWLALGCELRNEELLEWTDTRGEWTWEECDRTDDFVELYRPSVNAEGQPIAVFLRLFVDRAEQTDDGENWQVVMRGEWSEWVPPDGDGEVVSEFGPAYVSGPGEWITDSPAPGPLRALHVWADASGVRALELVPYFRQSRRFGTTPPDVKAHEIAFAGNECLIAISGRAADRDGDGETDSVTELSFVTNRRTLGPYGDAAATDVAFSFAVDGEGKEVCGFYGRFSDRVHRLGIIARDRR